MKEAKTGASVVGPTEHGLELSNGNGSGIAMGSYKNWICASLQFRANRPVDVDDKIFRIQIQSHLRHLITESEHVLRNV